ncbi:alanine racemase [Rhodohalobacter mucosus]|uniref:Alanine racemase n=1 Tax=Rhodohalobacter mucosus TaxID=2079485 RepID=A0A316TUZ4_9BACT|nr:alanine racemase [Rhodohalobacter mucosus]PWN07561.1 alanine racemase [Rhodohalobacter mucosus]
MPQRPRLIIDEKRCRRNIERIVHKAARTSTEFRPHFKTHQSHEVGNWFREAGVTGITVTSPEMAEYFVQDGWKDITIAFPFYPGMIKKLNTLSQNCAVRLFINSVEDLKMVHRQIKQPVSFYVELDAGYGRSGMPVSNPDAIHRLIQSADSLDSVRFHGFYIHDGGTYRARNRGEILKRIEGSLNALRLFKSEYPTSKTSLGDTPSASVLNSFEGLDECTPGNLVFYDRMQVAIGSCTPDDVALFAELPVAQVYEAQNRAMIHGGAVHLSKDSIEVGNKQVYGQRISGYPDSVELIEGSILTALSQEHGTLTGVEGLRAGDWITVMPIHSCLAANLFSHYETLDGRIINKRVLS